MNNPETYDRRIDRSLDEPSRNLAPETGNDVSALAVHRDPSRPTAAAATKLPTGTEEVKRSVTWVRPSDLPTFMGSAQRLRRGIDLQAELTRRARRAPVTAAARAGRRITRTAISRPENATTTVASREGMGL